MPDCNYGIFKVVLFDLLYASSRLIWSVIRPDLSLDDCSSYYEWLTDWLTTLATDWLIGLLADWLIDWLIDKLWLIDWLINWLINGLIDWLIDWLWDTVIHDKINWLTD